MVEDDLDLGQTLAEGLRQLAMAVDLASDGAEALDKLAINRYDVMVLDRDLPRVHGDEVCRRVVEQGGGPRILMLTAASRLEHRVDGLEIGADDYLPKPFAYHELVARIHALARCPARGTSPILRAGDLTFDVARRRVERNGTEIPLTVKEYAVLEAHWGNDPLLRSHLHRVLDAYVEHYNRARPHGASTWIYPTPHLMPKGSLRRGSVTGTSWAGSSTSTTERRRDLSGFWRPTATTTVVLPAEG